MATTIIAIDRQRGSLPSAYKFPLQCAGTAMHACQETVASVQTRYLTRAGPAVDPWPILASRAPSRLDGSGSDPPPLAPSREAPRTRARHGSVAKRLELAAWAQPAQRCSPLLTLPPRSASSAASRPALAFPPPNPPSLSLFLLPFASLPLSLSLPILSPRVPRSAALCLCQALGKFVCAPYTVRYRAGLCPPESRCRPAADVTLPAASPLSSLQ